METYEGESGPDFENRGLTLARALHDPMGVQGAVMHNGRERDGLFVTHDDINAYEFTVGRTVDKALKDGEKLAEILRDVGSRGGNGLKDRTGWLVTLSEPLAAQRSAIETLAKKHAERIHIISVATLQQRICNSEMYTQARDNAPFGSISFGGAIGAKTPNVTVALQDASGGHISIRSMAEKLLAGERSLLVGDYGVGKSHSLRELYLTIRREHFRRSKLTPFPIHINLRDCAGLRSPSEILRRHAEDIGFDHANGLISAWRAGTCILLLDGFDEIIPSRWFGGASDLKTVRWEALSPIRRLVGETPAGAGIIVAGRSHYFSSRAEMASALGFRAYESFSVPEFDETQLKEFLDQAGVKWAVPDWVPMRPLLLGYLVSINADAASGVAAAVNRASGWRRFIDAICLRESHSFSGVRPDTVRRIVSRVATLARSRSDVTGPVTMEMLSSAFVAVNGYQPDEEGVQLLLRLPGLAVSKPDDSADLRVFADRDLADTAYGLDLVDYIANPYEASHPLSSIASWATASTDLGIEVAADALNEHGSASQISLGALTTREKSDKHDAVMADLLRVAMEMPLDRQPAGYTFPVTGVFFEDLVLSDHPISGAIEFRNCVIEQLDVSGIDDASPLPRFVQALIGHVDGVSSMPAWMTANFDRCEIGGFSAGTETTASIMQLNIAKESRVALNILKKVFGQRGSARKEGALARGLPLSDRPLVPKVVDDLVSQGWLYKSVAGNNVIYVGVKERRRDALRALEAPNDFNF